MSVEVSGDAELEDALSAIAGLDNLGLKPGKEKKMLHVNADFGRVVEVSTDLVKSSRKGDFRVNVEHPVVKKAIENGKVMFVVSTLYRADHCNVAICTDKADQQNCIRGKYIW